MVDAFMPVQLHGACAPIIADLRATLAALDPDCVFLGAGPAVRHSLLLSCTDQWDWNTDLDLLKQARQSSAHYLRIGFDADRVWVGPWVSPDAPGCSQCLRAWLRNAHPHKKDWNALYSCAPGTVVHHTYPAPILQMVCALVVAARTRPGDPDGAAGHRSVTTIDMGRGSIERHAFMADPHCAVCARMPNDSAELADIAWRARPKSDARNYRAPNPHISVANLEDKLVGWRAGFVKHIFQDVNSDILPLVAAEQPLLEDDEAVEVGYGRADTVADSRRIAILETIERFVGQRARGTRTMVRGSARQIGAAGVAPEAFILHHPDQSKEPGYNYPPYSDDLEYNWVWGYSWKRAGPVLVPEQMVYYGRAGTKAHEVNRFVYESSSGCALGGSIEEATYYGLLELIERDAYLTTWYGQIAPVLLDVRDATDPAVRGLIARAEGEGYQLHVFDMGLEFGVPAIWAMLVDPRPNAPVKSYCAAAAHPDPERAIFSALVEVTTSISVYAQSMPPLRDKARAIFNDPGLLQTIHDHVLLYSLEETLPWLDFLFKGDGPVPLRQRFAHWYENTPAPDLLDDLSALVQSVLTVASDVIVVDQGFDGLKPFGLSAARILAPGLLPVTFGTQHRRICLDRLHHAAKSRAARRRYTLDTINPNPHNFP